MSAVSPSSLPHHLLLPSPSAAGAIFSRYDDNCGSATVPKASAWHEVGGEGSWVLSSAKPGNGVHELRDNNPNTFWQSDDPGPHTVTVQFSRLTRVSRVDLLLNYRIDESYTPHVIAIRLGNTEKDLQLVKEVLYEVDVEDPPHDATWFPIELDAGDALAKLGEASHSTDEEDAQLIEELLHKCDYLETFCLQLVVTANHQNGRDTHIRQIRIYGPVEDMAEGTRRSGAHEHQRDYGRGRMTRNHTQFA